ncbi:glycoside hydrolase family 105 protein [Arenibacter sp. ARW7G5Y1]|uniref:glycoside hydrolase family 88/105 protein n=1 Tax=Arenibacter sp. ARW7G5Y1 TaxID=2135619 RepID=UPI000D771A94|nr:glycoside hydrolase family 88 protein [Arenibacter sp. ARW7G5Y1]PXX30431.1 unsaturated rhamnogalacturonyl hydrolase [Arenibacter sp. ARW7G5Y1]
MKNLRTYISICVLTIGLSVTSCKETKGESKQVTEDTTASIIVPENLKWSERMLMSEIERFPDPTKLDFVDKPRWSYTNGLVLSAAIKVYGETKKQEYYDYIYAYANDLIDSTGTIKTYSLEDQNLDMIKSGDVLLYLYDKTKEERFLKAMQILSSQMDSQPRTSDGGFWHKKRYPYQMWLDGLYMAEPFHAHYTKLFEKDGEEAKKIYDDILLQFDLIQKHCHDEKTGLLYHGWDESREQKWADKKTGTSPHFWSRAMGWYGMALVDVLDFLPKDHPGRERIITYLNQFAEAVTKYQDTSGLWYQVLDQGDREGNYLEASGSSMFTYTFAKGAHKGYLPEKYLGIAEKAYSGILENLISIEDNGVVNLNKVCGVAGLGGDPYRDGSYEYYVNEIIRSNDPKGTGPFILASLELNK